MVGGERSDLEVVLGAITDFRREVAEQFKELVPRREFERAIVSLENDDKELRQQIANSLAEHQKLHDRISAVSTASRDGIAAEGVARRSALDDERREREAIAAEQSKQKSARTFQVVGMFIAAGLSLVVSIAGALAVAQLVSAGGIP